MGVVSGEPWVVEALVGRHPLFLLLGQQPLDELLALLTHVDKGLLVKLPSTRLPRKKHQKNLEELIFEKNKNP